MSLKTPKFSLVFLTWNSEDVITETLDAVIQQEEDDFETIVVDNDSDDNTPRIVKEEYGDVRLVRNETNLGYTKGINRGVDEASGRFICCYNDDTLLPPTYLSVLDQYVTESSVWTTARVNYRVSESYRCVRLIGRQRFPIPYVVGPKSGTAPVNYVPGDGLIIPRAIYENILDEQLLSPAMGIRGDDFELSLRLDRHDVPMTAILDTASTHPDKGIYDPTVENLRRHLQNVVVRYQAHVQNDRPYSDRLLTLVSALSLPISIYFGNFPRSETEFDRELDRLDLK